MPVYADRNRAKILAAMLMMLSTSACITHPSQSASEFLDAGHSHANYINVSEQDSIKNIVSYGRTSGRTEIPLEEDDIMDLHSMEGRYSKITIYAPSRQHMEAMRTAVRAEPDTDPDFAAAAQDAITESIRILPAVRSLHPHLQLLAAPAGSGHSFEQQARADESPVPIGFVIAVSPETSVQNAVRWWMNAVDAIGHELLHLEHKLSGHHQDSRQVDFEVAAYLLGQCARSRFAQALDLNELLMNIELNPDAFPGIKQPNFSPDMDAIRSLGNPSQQGRTIALALIYHLYADESGVVNLADAEVTAPMHELCSSLPRQVPAFAEGGTGQRTDGSGMPRSGRLQQN